MDNVTQADQVSEGFRCSSYKGTSNAAFAFMGGAPLFCASLGLAVGNDGEKCAERGAFWLQTFLTAFIAREYGCRPEDVSAFAAFDLLIYDIESIERIWPLIADERCNGILARFLIERCPALWSRPYIMGHTAPVTRALHIAEQIDTLVSFFNIGIRPTGSKDPFALRRAANNLFRQLLFPIGAHQGGQAQ